MTKFKVCSKIHLFIIISVIFIAIGMAVGTICHFCANGFFNYGGEFSSYKSVVVDYATSESNGLDGVKAACDKSFKGLKPYEVQYTDTELGGEIVYKFTSRTDSAALKTAVDGINAELRSTEDSLNIAALHEGVVNEGGKRAIDMAAIALASAAAFLFLYFIVRYKLRSAYSALLACVHNLGIFVALAAITRIPVGTEMIAIGAAVVFATMILSCIFFDKTRKNFKDEAYAKTGREEVVDVSACEVGPVTFIGVCALAACALVFGAFAAISEMWIGAFAPAILAVFGMIACGYGAIFFTPAVHGSIDEVCENSLLAIKAKRKEKAAKAPKRAKPEKSAKGKA